MLEKPTGLDEILRRYQQLTGIFPPTRLSPRQIIDVIIEREREDPDDLMASRSR
jgi:hypothetical protein